MRCINNKENYRPTFLGETLITKFFTQARQRWISKFIYEIRVKRSNWVFSKQIKAWTQLRIFSEDKFVICKKCIVTYVLKFCANFVGLMVHNKNVFTLLRHRMVYNCYVAPIIKIRIVENRSSPYGHRRPRPAPPPYIISSNRKRWSCKYEPCLERVFVYVAGVRDSIVNYSIQLFLIM